MVLGGNPHVSTCAEAIQQFRMNEGVNVDVGVCESSQEGKTSKNKPSASAVISVEVCCSSTTVGEAASLDISAGAAKIYKC